MRDTNERNESGTRGRYVGPSAARIAELLPQRVRFERGWFQTTADICHGVGIEQLTFRQRRDGNGIELRCHSVGCSREHIISRLEALTGESIWSAYAPHEESARPVAAGQAAAGRPNRRLVLLPLLLLALAAPLALGCDLQVAALNAFGFGWAAWLVQRIALDRLRSVGRRRR